MHFRTQQEANDWMADQIAALSDRIFVLERKQMATESILWKLRTYLATTGVIDSIAFNEVFAWAANSMRDAGAKDPENAAGFSIIADAIAKMAEDAPEPEPPFRVIPGGKS